MDIWLGARVWEIILFTSLYATTMILAILGNLTLLIVVTQNTTGRLKNVTNIFICNLAIADFFIALLVIPYRLCAYIFVRWPLGAFLCFIMPAAEKILFTVSIFQMLAMAAARYVAIVHPLRQQLHERGAFIVIFIVWLLAIASNAPLFMKMHVDMFSQDAIAVNQCRPKWNDSGPFARGYYMSQTLTHAIPFILTLLIYAAIYYHMKHYKKNGKVSSKASLKTNQNVVNMLVTMLLLSILCWLPYSSIITILIFRPLNAPELGIILGVCKWFALFNSCHNPIVCIAYSKSFRFGFFYLFGIKNDLVITELERRLSKHSHRRHDMLSFKFRNDSVSSMRRTNTMTKNGDLTPNNPVTNSITTTNNNYYNHRGDAPKMKKSNSNSKHITSV
ncbi:Tachykinin-like peptides receptor 99D [Trichoplax sp. H2]|nr:Tachykinin-like peptides receptor 99D [Trichoplax sp. H2]|eukprot:RDD38202.1 Tachykinin-like peptides receptor 99D [Trichoplax sp. H2]